MAPLKIVSNVSRFKPALHLNRVLANLNGGLNFLNSISGLRISNSKVFSSDKACSVVDLKLNCQIKLRTKTITEMKC